MKRSSAHVVSILVVLASLCGGASTFADELRAWGLNDGGQVSDVPAGSDYAAIAAGDSHGLALKSDGTVVAWGQNADGQCDVPLGTYKAIGAGARFSLAVRSGGSIAAWGDNNAGQVSDLPAGNDYVAVAGGLHFAVALRSNGTVVAWGDDRYGQVSEVPTGRNFVAITAGDGHAMALRSDRSLVVWGYWGAVEEMPVSGSYAAISAADNHCLALTADGAIVSWGDMPEAYGLDVVPAGTGYVGIAAGYLHGLAIASDGSVAGWGAGTKAGDHPNWGQAAPPAGHDYTAVAGGLYFSVGLAKSPDTGTISDDFDDNRQGSIWSLDADDLSSCWLEEVNQRLELRATAKANWASAFYLAKGWSIDPADDFSLRVDFKQEAELGESTWLSVVLTPSVENRASQHVEFGVGSDDAYPHLWLETIDETIKYNKSTYRRDESGTLFISYDASLDELYFSPRGYGAENAWATTGNLLQGVWAGQAITVGLGGGSNRVQIDSGQACLDNFALETTGDIGGQLTPVYRFWSLILESHFYTISEDERDRLVREYADVWTLEGTVFSVVASPVNADLAPVYRFWAPKTGAHLYTIDEAEKDRLIKEGQGIWTFEGVVFYAYPEGRQPKEAKPVYRFSDNVTGGDFYTISESEKDRLIKEQEGVLTFEGVGFYAYE